MTCYHPLKAFVLGIKENGKKELKVTSFKVERLLVSRSNGTIVPNYDSDVEFNKYRHIWEIRYKIIDEWLQIPCGHCLGCHIKRSKDWAIRCMLEMEYHESSYFITLTYDDYHLPTSVYADEDGVKQETGNLVLRDFQLFMKRLRMKYARLYPDNPPLRVMYCGEYGSETFRPHWHAIVFGLKLDDLVLYKQTNGYCLYNSEFLQSCWRDSDGLNYGYVVVGNATFESCSYVARYICKKLGAREKDFYEQHNINPEIFRVSNRPGLAKQWYIDHPDLYDYDYINISTLDGGKKYRPPSYYDRLFDVDYPEKSAALKQRKKELALALTDAKMRDTDLSYLDMLQVEENVLKNKVHIERSVL